MAQDGTDFIPSKQQLDFLEAFVLCGHRATIAAICRESGVPRRTYYNWTKNREFVKWFVAETRNTVEGTKLPYVWQSLFLQCVNGHTQACRLFMKQFDELFVENDWK